MYIDFYEMSLRNAKVKLNQPPPKCQYNKAKPRVGFSKPRVQLDS